MRMALSVGQVSAALRDYSTMRLEFRGRSPEKYWRFPFKRSKDGPVGHAVGPGTCLRPGGAQLRRGPGAIWRGCARTVPGGSIQWARHGAVSRIVCDRAAFERIVPTVSPS